MSSQPRFFPGVILAQRFRVVDLLGCGGTGEVYHAYDISLDEPVALKRLPEGKRTELAIALLKNEVRRARQISIPSICRTFDFGQVDGRARISDFGSLAHR